MAWGRAAVPQGIDDLVKRIAANDPKLTSLVIMKHRRLAHQDVAALASALAANTQLTELYASNHAMSPASAALLADCLVANKALQSLCIGDATFGDAGVEALCAGVALSRSLARLDLAQKGLTARGAEALGKALHAGAVLTHLVLQGNDQLKDAGVAALTSAAGASGGQAQPGRLRTLELQGCGITAAGIRTLASSPACVGQLEVLHLEGNELGSGAGSALVELLRAAGRLRELRLRGTALGDAEGAALASGLAGALGADRSVVLDVADCGLGAASTSAFAAALAAGAGVQSLDLAGNSGVQDADAAALAEAAASKCSLAQLDLSGTQAGARAVAALSHVGSLTRLSLVGAPLRSEGAAALACSFAEAGRWASLEDLSISGTGLTLADADSIFSVLQHGAAPRLKSLEVGANPATQQDAFPERVAALRDARPELHVFWRSGDDPAPPVGQ